MLHSNQEFFRVISLGLSPDQWRKDNPAWQQATAKIQAYVWSNAQLIARAAGR